MGGSRKVKTLHRSGQKAEIKLDPDTGQFFSTFAKKRYEMDRNTQKEPT